MTKKNEADSMPKSAAKKSSRRKSCRLAIEHLGPITQADVEFGDLTVIVGQQATGKSVFLQTLKLVIDRDQIHDMFQHHSMSFTDRPDAFLEGYFGQGMAGAWGKQSDMSWNGKNVDLIQHAKPTKSRIRHQRLFYIPAQRVMSLPGGVSQNFGQFNYGDPFALRAFSDAVHDLIQNEFGAKGELFPAPNKLNDTLRKPISEHLFGGNKLLVDNKNFTKSLALSVPGQDATLGFLAWSAGQREFAPMLMGLYWLCTVKTKRRTGKTAQDTVDWVVVEEPEMGLHPQGISAVLLLVIELLRRGYKVVVSTHSQVVLELVWALQEFKKLAADESDVRDLFDLPATPIAKELGNAALDKDYKVYFFGRDGVTRDISHLDPGADDVAESEWGGLSGFSNRTNTAIANAVNKSHAKPRRKSRVANKEST